MLRSTTETWMKGTAKVISGSLTGDVEVIRLGLQEGGDSNALLTPHLGESVLKLGRYGVNFPYFPALHAAIDGGTKQNMEAAFYLANSGADLNLFKIALFGDLRNISKEVWMSGRGLGYPPALLFALGMGRKPTNAHAALLQRLYLSLPDRFNKSHIQQWVQESGSSPLTHIALTNNFFDGLNVLVTVMGYSVNELDSYGVSTLHVGMIYTFIFPSIDDCVTLICLLPSCLVW